LASAQCREGKVTVDGKAVKPAQELKATRTFECAKERFTLNGRFWTCPRAEWLRLLVAGFARDITPEAEKQKLEEIRAAQRDLLRPTGRPTKRDRRDWEKWFS
jgi:hypothetical protein